MRVIVSLLLLLLLFINNIHSINIHKDEAKVEDKIMNILNNNNNNNNNNNSNNNVPANNNNVFNNNNNNNNVKQLRISIFKYLIRHNMKNPFIAFSFLTGDGKLSNGDIQQFMNKMGYKDVNKDYISLFIQAVGGRKYANFLKVYNDMMNTKEMKDLLAKHYERSIKQRRYNDVNKFNEASKEFYWWQNSLSRAPRPWCNPIFYPDTKSYYESLANDLDASKLEKGDEIMFSGWALNIKIGLIRSNNNHAIVSLNERIKQGLKKGVNYRMILWKNFAKINWAKADQELWFARESVHTNSETKKEVEELNKLGYPGKAEVLLHPSGITNDRWLWSHHEKYVIFKKKKEIFAYIGGTDLDHSRWDDIHHNITNQERRKVNLPDTSVERLRRSNNLPDIIREHLPKSPQRSMAATTLWSDSQVRVNGAVAKDLYYLFERRWIDHKLSNKNGLGRLASAFTLNPKGVLNHMPISRIDKNRMNDYDQKIDMTLFKDTINLPINTDDKRSCELISSRSLWSGETIPNVDTSMYETWKNLITKAKKYILIQQQYLISKGGALKRDGSLIFNKPNYNDLSIRIVQKIVQAHREKNRNFFVGIILPWYPDLNQWVFIRRTVRFMMLALDNAIGRNKWRRYLGFFGIRSFEFNNDQQNKKKWKIRSSPVYIHEKIIIIDDEEAIVGSANINDRSMEGDRDSETGIHFVDRSKNNNFVKKMRQTILSIHSGLMVDNSISALARFNIIAEQNTKCYDHIFKINKHGSIPSNQEEKDVTGFGLETKNLDNISKSELEGRFACRSAMKGTKVVLWPYRLYEKEQDIDMVQPYAEILRFR